MKNKYKNLFISLGIVTSLFVFNKANDNIEKVSADVFNDQIYYASAEGKTGSDLLNALHTTINTNYNGVGYDGLWQSYKVTDLKTDGTIRDYYSSKSRFIPGEDQAGNYSKEGDAYNREHSIPKSWWGGSTGNQGNDLFIVVPTDGYVNSIRGNHPFGEVKDVTYSSYENFSKLGTGNNKNDSGTVFEPNDIYKGDFARIYFYAVAKWNTISFRNNEGQYVFDSKVSAPNYGLTNYAKELFLKWNAMDPVDEVEIERNNRVFNYQHNRNPFVDHPEFISYIWGGGYVPPVTKEISSLSVSGTASKLNYVSGQSFNPQGLTITARYTDSSTENVTNRMVWSPDPLTTGTTEVTGTFKGKTITISGLTVVDYSSSTNYTLANTSNPLCDGDSIIFTASVDDVTYGAKLDPTRPYYLDAVECILNEDKTTLLSIGKDVTEFKLKKNGAYWNVYLGELKLGVSNQKSLSVSGGVQDWNISFSSNDANITCTNSSYGSFLFNTSNPRFTFYTSQQTSVQIYRMSKEAIESKVSVTGVELDKSEISLNVGESEQLVATVIPGNAFNIDVIWYTSDSNVAQVSNGLVVAVGNGICFITVETYDGNFKNSCTIYVGQNTNDSDEEEETTPSNKGCFGSINNSATLLISISSILIFLFFLNKKKRLLD